jgi:putative methyltransferase (TIGR04325 family)
MYGILNQFLNSAYFDKLPRFITKKIFKIFKIFFVETNLKSLPVNNHPTEIDKNQSDIIKNIDNKFYKPFSTCSFLLELLTLYKSMNENKNVSILDFGANNIDNYVYLNRYMKNWEYFYNDLPNYNHYIEEFVKKNNLKNINVIKDLSKIRDELDFVFFGSSIHYANNYKEIIKNISKAKSKYLIFSHTPFYKSNVNNEDIVMKQVNIHPTVNYAYLIEYNNFIKFMDDNNYELILQNKNNFIKFLNFKNFKNFSFLSFLDLFFKRKDQI